MSEEERKVINTIVEATSKFEFAVDEAIRRIEEDRKKSFLYAENISKAAADLLDLTEAIKVEVAQMKENKDSHLVPKKEYESMHLILDKIDKKLSIDTLKGLQIMGRGGKGNSSYIKSSDAKLYEKLDEMEEILLNISPGEKIIERAYSSKDESMVKSEVKASYFLGGFLVSIVVYFLFR